MKRMNKKARRYLLTFDVEPESYGLRLSGGFVGGRWGWQTSESGDTVHFFVNEEARVQWVANSPLARCAVGKRHPLVKAFRTRMEQEERHERALKRARDAAHTTWMWEAP